MSTEPTVYALSSIEIGQKAFLDRKSIDRKLEKKLLALGFSNLIPVTVIHKRKGGVVVGIGNARIALDQALANQISVKVA